MHLRVGRGWALVRQMAGAPLIQPDSLLPRSSSPSSGALLIAPITHWVMCRNRGFCTLAPLSRLDLYVCERPMFAPKAQPAKHNRILVLRWRLTVRVGPLRERRQRYLKSNWVVPFTCFRCVMCSCWYTGQPHILWKHRCRLCRMAGKVQITGNWELFILILLSLTSLICKRRKIKTTVKWGFILDMVKQDGKPAKIKSEN